MSRAIGKWKDSKNRDMASRMKEPACIEGNLKSRGRSPLIDGFGLIAFASLFPMITVMGYAQIGAWRARRLTGRAASKEDGSK
jgi:hypothetical protein